MELGVNLWAVLAAVVVMFGVGAVWYTFIFQKAWSRIHGFDKLSKAQQHEMMSKMGPVYGAQLLVTVFSALVLTYFLTNYTDLAYYTMAFFIWLGFVMPTQVSGVLFSRTEDRYKFEQIMIMSSEALVRLVLAAWVISLIVR